MITSIFTRRGRNFPSTFTPVNTRACSVRSFTTAYKTSLKLTPKRGTNFVFLLYSAVGKGSNFITRHYDNVEMRFFSVSKLIKFHYSYEGIPFRIEVDILHCLRLFIDYIFTTYFQYDTKNI